MCSLGTASATVIAGPGCTKSWPTNSTESPGPTVLAMSRLQFARPLQGQAAGFVVAASASATDAKAAGRQKGGGAGNTTAVNLPQASTQCHPVSTATTSHGLSTSRCWLGSAICSLSLSLLTAQLYSNWLPNTKCTRQASPWALLGRTCLWLTL